MACTDLLQFEFWANYEEKKSVREEEQRKMLIQLEYLCLFVFYAREWVHENVVADKQKLKTTQ